MGSIGFLSTYNLRRQFCSVITKNSLAFLATFECDFVYFEYNNHRKLQKSGGIEFHFTPLGSGNNFSKYPRVTGNTGNWPYLVRVGSRVGSHGSGNDPQHPQYLRFMTFFMRKLKNPKNLIIFYIYELPTHKLATYLKYSQTSFIANPDHRKTDKIKNFDTIYHFQIEKIQNQFLSVHYRGSNVLNLASGLGRD